MTIPNPADPIDDAVAASYVPTPYTLDARAPRSKRLGAVALVLALIAIVGSVAASVVIGMAAGPVADHVNGFYFNASLGSSNATVRALSGFIGLQIALGTLVGTWAFVQSIVAIARNRGRGYGILALVLAVIAPGVSLVVFFIVGASTS